MNKNNGFLTLREFLHYTIGTNNSKKVKWGKLMSWPPNAYALCAALLDETGQYTHLVSPSNSQCHTLNNFPPPDEIEAIGLSWCRNISKREKILNRLIDETPTIEQIPLESLVLSTSNMPRRIIEAISRVFHKNCLKKSLYEHVKDEILTDILFILSVSDSASMGFGVDSAASIKNTHPTLQPTFSIVDFVLLINNRESLATFCRSRISVLPKTLVPPVGISINSLSHHLSMIRGEVTAYWNDIFVKKSTQTQEELNILIIPLPFEVLDNQFQKITSLHKANKANYFSYSPSNKINDIIKVTEKLLNSAHKAKSYVDIIIYPEAAFTLRNYKKLLISLKKISKNLNKPPAVIAGVLHDEKSETDVSAEQGFRTKNTSIFTAPSKYETLQAQSDEDYISTLGYEQVKHHRWQLDEKQIQTYDLGKQFQDDCIYWEGISIETRQIVFHQWGNWFSFCTLICEDLARQEPIASAIRSVGPNLIVALLLDGPQLPSRWPGRHATTLTEEPGSSVLTVTALGMTERSKPKSPTIKIDKSINRTVALWKDQIVGAIPLVLEEEKHGIVLNLASHWKEGITADGRSDGGMSLVLKYKNHFSI